MMDVPDEITREELLNLNILLNSALNGLTIAEINLDVISRLKEQAGPHSHVVDLVLNAVAEPFGRMTRTCRYIPAEPLIFSNTRS